ncbi:LPS assembly protein LptD, partial [Escherichia coli]|uniref:LPS assembly protein LptD n=1 Tax=Escherichia coli TaxID=562 RepID=UPI003CE47F2A
LFYLNIPEKKRAQEAFPNFDSSSGSNSSFGHFFRENRFFGGDRVGDTQQISLGLTSRIINHDDGRQRLKLSVGQIFFLEDREVGL